nr:hypothetical protein [uncultured Draconibacterium sp.]
MKKYKIIISTFFVALFAINAFMTNQTFKENNISLNQLMSLTVAHAAELPDIVVDCSTGTYGKCRTLRGDFCPGYPLVLDVYARCVMTANVNVYCSPADEVYCD